MKIYECLIYDNRKVDINDSYYTFEKFESKVVKKLKEGYYSALECNRNEIAVNLFDSNDTNNLVEKYIIDFVNRDSRENFDNNIFNITDGTFRLYNFFRKIKTKCNKINYIFPHNNYDEWNNLKEELVQLLVYDDGSVYNRDYHRIDFDFIYNKVLEDIDMRYYPLFDKNDTFVVMKYKATDNTVKRLIFPFLESYSYTKYLEMDYDYNLGVKELYTFFVKIKQKYGACLVNNDGSVIFEEKTLNFQEFEDMLLKDIDFKFGFGLDYNSNNIVLNYTSKKESKKKKLIIDFIDRKAYDNYIFENFYKYNQGTYNVYSLLIIIKGNFNQIVNKPVDNNEKRIYLDYLSDSKKYLKDNENRIFLKEFIRTFGYIALVLLVILSLSTLVLGTLNLTVGGIFCLMDFYLSFVINNSVLKDKKKILEDRKFKINALTKELDGNQKTIERKCEQQVQDFTKQQENILDVSYHFNNRILEDVHNLLDKISILNQEAKNTLLLRVETLLSDYEKRVKDIEKNKDTVFYSDDYFKLKQDVYGEISKIELEIEKISKREETEKKMTKDLEQLRSEMKILQDKEAKSLIENATLNDDSYKEINNYDSDNVIVDNVQYNLTSAYDRKKLLEVLSKSGCIVGNVEEQDVDVDFLKMILSSANSEVFKFDVSNQFSELKVLKRLMSDFSDDEVKPHIRTKKL